jgi:hypothetical protein
MVKKEEIKKALLLMSEYWSVQNDVQDKDTKFIYTVDNVDELIKICKERHIDENYALHRWYNFNCAKWHEYFFCQHSEVRKEENPYHKTVDFYINETPFDLKASPYPKKLNEKLDLIKRADKNKLINWLYANQSQQGRHHLDNRLFIICDNLKNKSDFDLIEQKINAFIDYSNKNGFNRVQINGKEICSDIIYINN